MKREDYFNWLEKKLVKSIKPNLKPTTVSIKYTRQFGARGLYAMVKISAEHSDEFSFVSKAEWSESDNFDKAILDGILTALFSYKSKPILGGKFTIESVKQHLIDSNYEAFFQAAKQATQEILRHNGYGD